MRDAAPQPIYLADYRPPAWLVDEVHLTFGLPDAAIPAELGVSGDRRKLGISVISVCLFPQSLAEEIIRKTAEKYREAEQRLTGA